MEDKKENTESEFWLFGLGGLFGSKLRDKLIEKAKKHKAEKQASKDKRFK